MYKDFNVFFSSCVFTDRVFIYNPDDEDTNDGWENDNGGRKVIPAHSTYYEPLHVRKEKKEETGRVSTRSLTKDDVDTINTFLSRCQYHAGWEKAREICNGCKISHPSQRQHSCLFDFDQIRRLYFDQILDSVFKPSLGKALHHLFAHITPGAFSQEKLLGAAETLRHHLKPECDGLECDGLSAELETDSEENHKYETALRNAFTVWTKCTPLTDL